MDFLQHLINGIYIGAIYAIIALGYTMVYGIAKMLNFAHGDVIMVGAYMSYTVMGSLGLPVIPSILLAMLICTVLGVVIEGIAYKPLRGTSSLAVLITAIGVSYFLQNLADLGPCGDCLQKCGVCCAAGAVRRPAADLRGGHRYFGSFRDHHGGTYPVC